MRMPEAVMAATLAIALAMTAADPAHAHQGAHVIDPDGASRTTDILHRVPYDRQGPTGILGAAEFEAISEGVRRGLAAHTIQISVVHFTPDFGSHATTSVATDRSEWTLVIGDAGAVDAECRIVGKFTGAGMVDVISVGPGSKALIAHSSIRSDERIHAIYDPGPAPSIPGTVPGVRSCAYLANEVAPYPPRAVTASSRPDGTVPDLIIVDFGQSVLIEHDAARSGGYHPRLGDLGDHMRVIYCESCPDSDPDSMHVASGIVRPAAVLEPPHRAIVLSLLARADGPRGPAHMADTGKFWDRYLIEWDAAGGMDGPGIFRAGDIVPGVRNDGALGIRDHLRRGATPIAPEPLGMAHGPAPIEVEDALPPAPLLRHVVTGTTVIQVFTEEISEDSLEDLVVWRTRFGPPAITEELQVSDVSLTGRTLLFTAPGVGLHDHLEYEGISEGGRGTAWRPEIFDLERISDTQTVVMLTVGVSGSTHASHWHVMPAGGLPLQVTGAVLGHPDRHAEALGDAGVASSPWVTLTHKAIRGDAPRSVEYGPPPHTSYDDRFEGRLGYGGLRLNWQQADESRRGWVPPAITGVRFDGPETILVGFGRPVVAAPESIGVAEVVSPGRINESRVLGPRAMAPVAERPTPDSPVRVLTLAVPPAADGSLHEVRIEPSTIVDVAGNEVYWGSFGVGYMAGPRVASAQVVSATRTEVEIHGAQGHFGGSTLAADWTLVERLNGADVERAVRWIGHSGVGKTPAVEPWWPRLDIPPSRADGGRVVITLNHEALSSTRATPEVRYSAGDYRLGASDAFTLAGENPTARLLRSTTVPHPVASDGASVGLVSAVTAESDAGDGARAFHTVVTLSDRVVAAGSPTPSQLGSHWIVEDAHGNYEVPEATIHGRKVLLRHTVDPSMAYIVAYSPTGSDVGRLYDALDPGEELRGEVAALDGIPPRLTAVLVTPTSVIAVFSEPVNVPAGPASLSILDADGEPLRGHSVTSVLEDDLYPRLEFAVSPPLAYGTYALRLSGVEDDGRNGFGATVQVGLSAAPTSFGARSEGDTTVVTLDVPVTGRLDATEWEIAEDPDGGGPAPPVALAVSSVSHVRADGITVSATPGSPSAILAVDSTSTLTIAHEPYSRAHASATLSYTGTSLIDASGVQVAPMRDAPVAVSRDGDPRD